MKRVTKTDILRQAIGVVASRGNSYGPAEENFMRIARRWRARLMNRYGVDIALDAASVAIMSDDIKSARLENDPSHHDSWVDKAGYAACGGEIASQKSKGAR